MAHGLFEKEGQTFPLGFAQAVADVFREVLVQLDLGPTDGAPGLLHDGGELGQADFQIVLRGLHAAGVKLAVVSSNTEANIRVVLGPELSALVSQFACGATVFGKASKFKRVLKTLGVAPAEAISIGDEIRDLDAAREVGLATAVVCWGYTAPEALRAQKPDHVFEQIGDIPGRIA